MSNYLNTALKELFYEKDLRALGALCGRNFLNRKAHEGTRRSERREARDETRKQEARLVTEPPFPLTLLPHNP
jgi:hypothetical protein